MNIHSESKEILQRTKPSTLYSHRWKVECQLIRVATDSLTSWWFTQSTMLITLICSCLYLQNKKEDDLEVSKNEKKQIFDDVKTYLNYWMCESLCIWMFEANFLKAFICSQKAIEKQSNLIVREAWIGSRRYNEAENCAKQSTRRLTEEAYKNITSLFDNSNKNRSLSFNTTLQNRSIDSIFEQAYFKNFICLQAV